jgi:hypothetical protein
MGAKDGWCYSVVGLAHVQWYCKSRFAGDLAPHIQKTFRSVNDDEGQSFSAVHHRTTLFKMVSCLESSSGWISSSANPFVSLGRDYIPRHRLADGKWGGWCPGMGYGEHERLLRTLKVKFCFTAIMTPRSSCSPLRRLLELHTSRGIWSQVTQRWLDSFFAGQRPQDPTHVLQRERLQETHATQSDPIQGRQGWNEISARSPTWAF